MEYTMFLAFLYSAYNRGVLDERFNLGTIKDNKSLLNELKSYESAILSYASSGDLTKEELQAYFDFINN